MDHTEHTYDATGHMRRNFYREDVCAIFAPQESKLDVIRSARIAWSMTGANGGLVVATNYEWFVGETDFFEHLENDLRLYECLDHNYHFRLCG